MSRVCIGYIGYMSSSFEVHIATVVGMVTGVIVMVSAVIYVSMAIVVAVTTASISAVAAVTTASSGEAAKLMSGRLRASVHHGDVDGVRLLLSQGAPPGRRALHRAVRSGQVEITRLLLSHGTSPCGCCMIHAVRRGNVEMVRVLMDHNTPVPVYKVSMAACESMRSPRSTSAYGGRVLQATRTALSRSDMTLALVMAAYRGDAPVTRLLLDLGAQITRSVVIRAIRRGHIKVVRLLVNHGLPDATLAVRWAAMTSRVNILRLLVTHGYIDRDGAFIHAATCGSVPVVQDLLDQGPLSNLSTGLAKAACSGHVEVVKVLLRIRVTFVPSLIGDVVRKNYLAVAAVLVADRVAHMSLRKVQVAWRRHRLELAARRLAPLRGELIAVYNSPFRLYQLQQSGYISDNPTYNLVYYPDWILRAVKMIQTKGQTTVG